MPILPRPTLWSVRVLNRGGTRLVRLPCRLCGGPGLELSARWIFAGRLTKAVSGVCWAARREGFLRRFCRRRCFRVGLRRRRRGLCCVVCSAWRGRRGRTVLGVCARSGFPLGLRLRSYAWRDRNRGTGWSESGFGEAFWWEIVGRSQGKRWTIVSLAGSPVMIAVSSPGPLYGGDARTVYSKERKATIEKCLGRDKLKKLELVEVLKLSQKGNWTSSQP